ncbi:RraA family protein [candidate division KSB1 bacterium]|nr:RraA family protein [candidate division KSB1 bacterium]
MIKKSILFMLFFSSSIGFTQTASPDSLRNGIHFIETKVFSKEENEKLLALFAKLRVADVSDGMDMVGLPNTGLVDASILPLWIDTDSMKHVIRGIALTVRYVPTQRSDRPAPDTNFQQWEGQFYSDYSSEPFTQIIEPGHVIVIDDVEEKDIGSIGSNNILSWYRNGAVGVITDASSRDTDEIVKEGVPLYLRKKGRGIRPGRNELECINCPVSFGGVLICPGDVIVADGDGVIAVPRKVAAQVAKFAQEILKKDKAGRKRLYQEIGLPLDQTVQ